MMVHVSRDAGTCGVPSDGKPPLLLPGGRVQSLQTHDRSGFQPFAVLCPGAPHCRPTLICSACSVPRGPAAHDGPSPSFPCTCWHWAGKIQGKVDVQVGTTRIHKFSCCQDVIVPLLLGK